MADIHGSPADAPQMPAAPNSGPAPVPYGGADLSPEPPDYAAEMGPLSDPAADIMSGVVGLGTTESPVAHSLAAIDVSGDAPYYPGPLSPINAMGDPDAGGRDDVSGTVAGAVANATGRWQEFQGDNGAGGRIGDIMTLPPSPLDPGVNSLGTTDPAGAFYDPPRGGAPETFIGTGNEPG